MCGLKWPHPKRCAAAAFNAPASSEQGIPKFPFSSMDLLYFLTIKRERDMLHPQVTS